jgi:V/A-type H+-transporting ATPase subunit K
MKMLTSIIKTMKFSNLAIVSVTLAVVAFLALWLAMFGGARGAVAQTSTAPLATTTAQPTNQQTPQIQGVAPAGKAPQSAWGLALLAAALSTGLSAIAAGIAVAIVGSAAMGAVAERPEVMGRSIIFVGLAEGIAIYGLIISIMILGKL